MTSLLIILSKDPYTTEIPELVLDIVIDAKEKGNDVTLYLVEDGVTSARNSDFGKRLEDASNKGIKLYADDKAVLSRSLSEKLICDVEVKEIGTLLEFIMEHDRVVWF